jgi:hypothetical protein
MTGRSGQMRQTTTAELRLDEGKATSSVVARLAEAENRAQRLRYPENVSLTLGRPQVTPLTARRSAVIVAAATGHVGSVLSPELASPVRPSCAAGSAADE